MSRFAEVVSVSLWKARSKSSAKTSRSSKSCMIHANPIKKVTCVTKLCKQVYLPAREEGSISFKIEEGASCYFIKLYDDVRRTTVARFVVQLLQEKDAGAKSRSPKHLHELGSGSRAAHSTSDKQISKLASQWLRNCVYHHACLPKTSPSWYPSRLLEIS